MDETPSDARIQARWRACLRLTAWLMAIGFVVTFGGIFFARDLSFSVFGWPFSFWLASQGALVMYLVLVCVYAYAIRRLDERFEVVEDD